MPRSHQHLNACARRGPCSRGSSKQLQERAPGASQRTSWRGGDSARERADSASPPAGSRPSLGGEGGWREETCSVRSGSADTDSASDTARAAQAGSRRSAGGRAASRTPLGAAGELRLQDRGKAERCGPATSPCSAPELAQGVPAEGTVGTGGRNGPKETCGPASETTGQPRAPRRDRKEAKGKRHRHSCPLQCGSAQAPSCSRNTYTTFLQFSSGPSALDTAFSQSHPSLPLLQLTSPRSQDSGSKFTCTMSGA